MSNNNVRSNWDPFWVQKTVCKQEQQRVAVGPGNAHFISIRQVSSDAPTHTLHVRSAAAVAASAVNAAVYDQCAD